MPYTLTLQRFKFQILFYFILLPIYKAACLPSYLIISFQVLDWSNLILWIITKVILYKNLDIFYRNSLRLKLLAFFLSSIAIEEKESNKNYYNIFSSMKVNLRQRNKTEENRNGWTIQVLIISEWIAFAKPHSLDICASEN